MSEKMEIKHFETTVKEEQIFEGRVFRVGLRDVMLENYFNLISVGKHSSAG